MEILAHGRAPRRIFHDDKAPGLAQSHRRGKRGEPQQALDGARRWGIATEAADITPPHDEVAQRVAEGRVEGGHLLPRASTGQISTSVSPLTT